MKRDTQRHNKKCQNRKKTQDIRAMGQKTAIALDEKTRQKVCLYLSGMAPPPRMPVTNLNLHMPLLEWATPNAGQDGIPTWYPKQPV